ncbi:MAG TPA: IclR family transcriptional regulator [Myxococcota bacterium]|nr:IclR family transcriptional regulator [Myxococcota bacterium]
MKRPKSDYAIQTVSNALSLLHAFHCEEELGVTELSRRLGLHKNNVFRLLATLEQSGYVEQAPTSDSYRLSFACLELGHSFVRSRSLLREAQPLLEELSSDVQETAHLGVLSEYEVVHLAGSQPDELLSAGLRVGRRVPAHCTALGKVLVGCGCEAVRGSYERQVSGQGTLGARTPATIVDSLKLHEHLREVASQGFAIDLEECGVGVCCAAAPVYDGTGRLVAAVSVSGPAVRLGQEQLLRHVVPKLMACAERLSARLGAAVASGSSIA